MPEKIPVDNKVNSPRKPTYEILYQSWLGPDNNCLQNFTVAKGDNPRDYQRPDYHRRSQIFSTKTLAEAEAWIKTDGGTEYYSGIVHEIVTLGDSTHD